MPPFNNRKKYGTVRRGTARASFRGSVRAWDSQRNGASGLLRQQPDKENHNTPSDTDDSFVLESPPQSPLATPLKHVQNQSSQRAPLPVHRLQKPEQDAPAMPTPRCRQPLAPKPNHTINRQPSDADATNPKLKPKAGKQNARKPKLAVTQNEQPATTTTTTTKDVHASPQPPVQPPPPQTKEVQPGQHVAPAYQTPAKRDRHSKPRKSDENAGTLVAPAPQPSSTRSSTSTSFKSFAVEIVSSQALEAKEQAAELSVATAVTDNDDTEGERDDEVDDSNILSPQQRAALRKHARRRGRGRKSEALSQATESLPTDFRSLAVSTPYTSSTSTRNSPSTEESTPPSTPGFVESPSVDTASSSATDEDQLVLAAESEVFNLLRECDDKQLMSYTKYLEGISSDFSRIKKIGESSFAEVFIHRTADGRPVVLKFIPLSEEDNVREVLQELKTTRSLSPVDGFIKYLGCQVLCGAMPAELDSAWRKWEVEHNGGDYTPTERAFRGVEHHAVIALEDGGCSLEDTRWKTWDVPLEIFRQVLHALAQGEEQRRFEHRDLHSGNLLVRDLAGERAQAAQEDTGLGRKLEVSGFEELKVTIIDYTLSRADVPSAAGGGVAYLDIASDTFMADGLYQFEIYRMMKEEMRAQLELPKAHKHGKGREKAAREKLDWSVYCPRTNVVWLHYIIKILHRTDEGKRNGGKLHISKPRSKKNTFELACRESVMRIHDELNWGADDAPVRADFGGAADVLKWCESAGVFQVLEEERGRRAKVKAQAGEGVAGGAGEEEGGVVRRSRRILGKGTHALD
ncbi:hypothetical protein DRE_06031 [Drechslerella stenobrocha 248]|uniref:non-specific serine/threonine protein kinase n=1 Tax=Drechslerella stenobrocha 248 TaxID=1043628 RepID=W7HYY0_9PEZI|nr:hypothetical protein DRE_06031 [Drechslerella stenobrocha 248]